MRNRVHPSMCLEDAADVDAALHADPTVAARYLLRLEMRTKAIVYVTELVLLLRTHIFINILKIHFLAATNFHFFRKGVAQFLCW